MQINSISIKNFKRIKEAEIPLNKITVLIGGNNSGKSSVLQGIHFALTSLQSARSARIGGASDKTLGFDQLIYKPTNDLVRICHGIRMTQTVGPQFSFTYQTSGSTIENQKFELRLRRGKNANLSLLYSEDAFYERASDRNRPLSIFVPGLAGVSLREEKRTDAIVATGIAQGDSNLYIRNVLLRILDDPKKVDRFHEIIRDIFPDLTLSTNYDDRVHPYVDISVNIEGQSLPLEMVGTGCLQAIQLVAYVTMYQPALLLLDEPDAHLHPSKQRILATVLSRIVEDTGTSVILATHSRHLFDALNGKQAAEIIWMKNGNRKDASSSLDLSILLDLGALDSFEAIQGTGRKVVVLTEDTKYERLKLLLLANNFHDGEFFFQPFNGVDNIKVAASIAEFFVKLNDGTHVVIHRDGDCMLDDEKEWFVDRQSKELPERSYVFVTKFTDVEHYFCSSDRIAEAYSIPLEEAENILSEVLLANNANLAMLFAQKRNELKAKTLRSKGDAPSGTDLVTGSITFEQAKGKRLFGLLNQALINNGRNPINLIDRGRMGLEDENLRKIANLIWANS